MCSRKWLWLILVAVISVTRGGECPAVNEINAKNECTSKSKEERTFVMIKPDGVQRGLIGEIISRLERKGLQLVGMKFLQAERELIEEHYKEHHGKIFYSGLVSSMLTGPVIPMVWQGKSAVKVVRSLLGVTDPVVADSGTIRGDLAMDMRRNLCHASDSLEAAEREVNLWFQSNELVTWKAVNSDWVY